MRTHERCHHLPDDYVYARYAGDAPPSPICSTSARDASSWVTRSFARSVHTVCGPGRRTWSVQSCCSCRPATHAAVPARRQCHVPHDAVEPHFSSRHASPDACHAAASTASSGTVPWQFRIRVCPVSSLHASAPAHHAAISVPCIREPGCRPRHCQPPERAVSGACGAGRTHSKLTCAIPIRSTVSSATAWP